MSPQLSTFPFGVNNWESYTLFQAGVERQLKGDNKQARKLFLEALKKDPNNRGALINLGRLDIQDKNYQQAKRQLYQAKNIAESTLDFDTDWYTATYQLAVVFNLTAQELKNQWADVATKEQEFKQTLATLSEEEKQQLAPEPTIAGKFSEASKFVLQHAMETKIPEEFEYLQKLARMCEILANETHQYIQKYLKHIRDSREQELPSKEEYRERCNIPFCEAKKYLSLVREETARPIKDYLDPQTAESALPKKEITNYAGELYAEELWQAIETNLPVVSQPLNWKSLWGWFEQKEEFKKKKLQQYLEDIKPSVIILRARLLYDRSKESTDKATFEKVLELIETANLSTNISSQDSYTSAKLCLEILETPPFQTNQEFNYEREEIRAKALSYLEKALEEDNNLAISVAKETLFQKNKILESSEIIKNIMAQKMADLEAAFAQLEASHDVEEELAAMKAHKVSQVPLKSETESSSEVDKELEELREQLDKSD